MVKHHPLTQVLLRVIVMALGMWSFVGFAAERREAGGRPLNSIVVEQEEGVEGQRAHRLISGDRIDVKIAQDADLNAEVLVDLRGFIQLQLVGRIQVAGLTVEEASEAVRLAYQKDYIIEPTVSVAVLEYGQQRFTVIGEVKQPGDFLFRANKTVNVLQAIAIAGGYSPEADPRKITVKRKENGREVVHRINGKEMAADQNVKVFEIRSNDIISVGESLF